jgi:hypothetical protein
VDFFSHSQVFSLFHWTFRNYVDLVHNLIHCFLDKKFGDTRWFKYDRDLCGLFTHKSVPVIFEPPCIMFCHVRI